MFHHVVQMVFLTLGLTVTEESGLAVGISFLALYFGTMAASVCVWIKLQRKARLRGGVSPTKTAYKVNKVVVKPSSSPIMGDDDSSSNWSDDTSSSDE